MNLLVVDYYLMWCCVPVFVLGVYVLVCTLSVRCHSFIHCAGSTNFTLFGGYFSDNYPRTACPEIHRAIICRY